MVRVVWWRARVQRARVAVRWGSDKNLALVLAASPRYFLHDWLPVHTSSKRSIVRQSSGDFLDQMQGVGHF